MTNREEHRMTRNASSITALAFVAVLAHALLPGSASAVSLQPSTTGADTIYIGMMDVPGDGVVGDVPVACRNDIVTRLRSDTNTGGLNRDVVIDAQAGNDYIRFVRTANYAPPTSADCGDTTWQPITVFNGWQLDFDGARGNDIMEGSTGSTAMTLYADGTGALLDSYNYEYHYSSIGRLLGANYSADQLLSYSSGGLEHLSGGSGSDCLHDETNPFAELDCGTGTDSSDYTSVQDADYVGCENVGCCGLC
jgi:hypothetical protein